MHCKVIGAVALALVVVSLDPAAAQRTRSGVLDCDVSGGFGWIIGSQKSVACVFTPDGPAPSRGRPGSAVISRRRRRESTAGSLDCEASPVRWRKA